MGPKTKPNGHTEKKRDKCPNGTRKNKKGDCVDALGNVVVSVENRELHGVMNVQPLSPENVNSPNGSTGSPVEELVPKNIEQPNTTRKKRGKYCPKGSRRIKGVCVRISDGVEVPEIEERAIPADEDNMQQLPVMNTEGVPPVYGTVPTRIDRSGIDRISGETPKAFRIENTPNMDNVDECISKRNGINAFLAEKERVERAEYIRNPPGESDPLQSLYPDVNDPLFGVKLATHKEFYETKADDQIYDIRKQSDIMCELPFELSPHQLFVKNFLSIETPYNSLLLYHGLGTGKTCTAIGVAEETRKNMMQMGVRDRIIVVASPNVQVNFRLQLFNESKLVQLVNPTNPEEFTWNLDTCVGSALLKEIDPNSARNVPREKIVTNIQTIINSWYEFMGYGQLANYIFQKTKVSDESGFSIEERKSLELRKIRNVFNNKTIIIDEVHNITQTENNKHKTTGALLLHVAKYAVNMRLLLLSATPMFDTYKEIIWLINLMNANDKRSLIEISDVFDNAGNIKETAPVGANKKCRITPESGRELLIRKLTGYVSYVRGENPYIFPFRVYPDIFDKQHTFASGIPYPTVQMNDKPVSTQLKHVKVYLNNMLVDTYQRLAYKYILGSIKNTSRNALGDMSEINHFEMLQKPIECLNIVYPNKDFEEILRNPSTANAYSDGLITTIIGENGLHSIMKITGDKGGIHLPTFEYTSQTLERHGRVFSSEILPQYSHKMSNICNIIRRTDGIVLIYSQYIDGGVVPMALALEEMGFMKYGGESNPTNTTLFRKPLAEPLDATTMLPKSRVSRGEFRQATYIMITGNKMYSPNNAAEIAAATARENMDGSKIKVILISKAGSEGLDFKHIRQIHVLDPWYNMNRIEQIIGRGVRNLSHCGLPFEKRNVQIYLHGTLMEGETEEAVDLYIYRIAERKALQIGQVTRLLKTVSADCVLNVSGHLNMTAEKLMTNVENQRVEIQLATRERIVFRVGDQPFTDICDYMESCDYKCSGNESPSTTKEMEAKLVNTTYFSNHASRNVVAISKRVRMLFRENPAYKRDQLIRLICVQKQYPIEHIFYTLSMFIENRHEYLIDKYNRSGYLVNRGEYYVFQPDEITDEQTSVYERIAPVDVVRPELTLELPAEITKKVPNITEIVRENIPPPVAETAEPTPAVGDVAANTETADKIMDSIIQRHAITANLPVHTGKPKMEQDWYRNSAGVREHLLNQHDISAEQFTKYVIYHILDESELSTKLALLNHFFGDTEKTHRNKYDEIVSGYLESRMLRNTPKNKWGILLVEKMSVVLYIRSLDKTSPEWVIGEESEYTYFDADIKQRIIIDKSRLNQIIGYIIMFKDGDMSFKYKDITMLRNKIGAKCNSAGKADTLRLLNAVAENSAAYTQENTKAFFQPHLCVILEMLLRHYTDTRRNNRIYYLTPEETILNEITQYSTGK
jgi:hypothetical protein